MSAIPVSVTRGGPVAKEPPPKSFRKRCARLFQCHLLRPAGRAIARTLCPCLGAREKRYEHLVEAEGPEQAGELWKEPQKTADRLGSLFIGASLLCIVCLTVLTALFPQRTATAPVTVDERSDERSHFKVIFRISRRFFHVVQWYNIV